MLPILLILLFAPALYAGDFPNLMKAVNVTWDGVNVTANVTTSLTTSVDGQVPYFVLCGPFGTIPQDALCVYDWEYSVLQSNIYIYNYKGNSSNFPLVNDFLGQGVSATNVVYAYNENNTCLSIKNDIQDFVSHYQDAQKYSDEPHWTFSIPFVCNTRPPSNVLKYSIIGVVSAVLLAAAVFVGFKIGQKKNNNKQGETSAYNSFNRGA